MKMKESRAIKYNKPIKWKQLYVFGILVQLAMLSCMLLMPADMRIPIIKAVAIPILLIYPVLTMVIGLVLKKQEDRRADTQGDKRSTEHAEEYSEHGRLLNRGVPAVDLDPAVIFHHGNQDRVDHDSPSQKGYRDRYGCCGCHGRHEQ